MSKKVDLKLIAFVRFLRTFLPQLPAIISYLIGVKPEWSAGLALLGAIATAVDKYLRAKNA